MSDFEYTFTAQRGTQAGKDFFVIMCPLKLIPKIFHFNEEDVPAKMRAQRTLNKTRIPEISSYIINNPKEYIFSSITASVDGKFAFLPAGSDAKLRNIGHLSVDMNARFLINDGQHRRAAIEDALKENHDLAKETISIVLLPDAGLKRSQQMFADLNKHAVRPTKSLGILYDIRDEESGISRKVLEGVPLLRDMTDMEKTSLSNRSTKLFTLSSLFQANQVLLKAIKQERKEGNATANDLAVLMGFWDEVIRNMPDWVGAWKKNIATKDLRDNYIHAHGVTLLAIAHVGYAILGSKTWKVKLRGLKKINWSRTEPTWEGRTIVSGRISKSTSAVALTAIQIKKSLGIPLNPADIKEEHAAKGNTL